MYVVGGVGWGFIMLDMFLEAVAREVTLSLREKRQEKGQD